MAWADLYAAIGVADADDDIMGEDDLAEEFADPNTEYASVASRPRCSPRR